MKFDVPGFGVVSEENAVFTMFLKRLTRTYGHMLHVDGCQIKLPDIPVGGTAIAEFQSGMGSSVVEIRRVL